MNGRLAEWFWARFPADKQRQNVSQQLRLGPFRLDKWQRVVEVDVQHGVRAASFGFDGVYKKLFPENWVLRDTGPQWDTLQLVILGPIQERIAERDRPDPYSAHLRLAILAVIRTWEFLPCVHKQRIWSYDGPILRRVYQVYRNPRFAKK